MNKVHIVGIGDAGLPSVPETARRIIEQAQLVVGSDRTLTMVGDIAGAKAVIGSDLSEMVRRIEAARQTQKVVVLASGDPLFYGVARYLLDRIGKENFDVFPHVSSMQLAFARVKESWDEAYLSNLASQAIENVIDRIRIADKVGLFTTEQFSPSVIAKALLAEGINYFRVYVCENLGARNEVVTQGTLEEIAEMDFDPLNVMILARLPQTPDRQRLGDRTLFGNPDDLFRQSRPKRGLLTPAEVRTLAIAKLSIHPDSVIWDVGAGSGSVSIEVAQLAREGRVFAIEPDPEDCELIRDNARTFGVSNVEVIPHRAPDAFEKLPDPDCVFIGGIGRQTVGILPDAFRRLRPGGRLVLNVATLENVSSATTHLKPIVPDVGLLMVNLARGVHQLENIRFEALSPTFLIFAEKPRSA